MARVVAWATAASTWMRSTTAMRPHRNASRFISTDTPLRRIAFSIDAAETGRAPAWYAAPSMIGLIAM